MENTNTEMDTIGPRSYRNNAKAIALSNDSWEQAKEKSLVNLRVNFKENELLRVAETGHEFLNLCSCSYLGLSSHPKILQGAIDAVRDERVLHLSMSTTRIQLDMKNRLEEALSGLFGVTTLQALSASVAIFSTLPLLASGHLSDGRPPVMVFDRFCHFSMAYMKPVCSDETLVLTCPNDDLDFLEDACRKYPRVAYVTDGVYSMGGLPSLEGLLQLQDKYGLLLYFDDSHSVSIKGAQGEGFIKSSMGELNEKTIVIGSLGKGFGANGGAIMLGPKQHADIIRRYGGPVGWSQDMNVAGMGAILASVDIHRSSELEMLQKKLQDNIALFDNRIKTPHTGNNFPIRLIVLGEEETAVQAAKDLFEKGFYSSAVYFPIVPRGQAGIRIMIRANLSSDDILRFCDCLNGIIEKHGNGNGKNQ